MMWITGIPVELWGLIWKIEVAWISFLVIVGIVGFLMSRKKDIKLLKGKTGE